MSDSLAARKRPQPRLPRRVSEQAARQVLRRMAQEGSLGVVLDVLRDHRDALLQRAQQAMGAELLVDVHSLARFQARQGAIDECTRVIRILDSLGHEMPPPETER